jgi:hypothetical protein
MRRFGASWINSYFDQSSNREIGNMKIRIGYEGKSASAKTWLLALFPSEFPVDS